MFASTSLKDVQALGNDFSLTEDIELTLEYTAVKPASPTLIKALCTSGFSSPCLTDNRLTLFTTSFGVFVTQECSE